MAASITSTTTNTRIKNKTLSRVLQFLVLAYLIASVGYYLFVGLPTDIPKVVCEGEALAKDRCYLSIRPEIAAELIANNLSPELIYHSILVVDFFINCLF